MKIMLMINNLSSGGAQKQLVLLANQLNACNNEVHLVVLSCNTSSKRFYFTALCDEVYVYDMTGSNSISSFMKTLKILYKCRIECMYTFLESANLFGTLAGRTAFGKRIGIVNSLRGTAEKNFKHICFWGRLGNYVITNSNYGKKILTGRYKVDSEKVKVIYNGINITHAKKEKLPVSEMCCLMVGRICHVKNQMELLKAVQEMKGKECFKIKIVGSITDRPYYEELKKYVECKQIANVHFLGETNRIEEHYNNASFLVITSKSESTPNVLLEAISYDLPVISSDVGDVSKFIEHGSNGYIYTSGDYKKLASYLSLMVNGEKCINRKMSPNKDIMKSLSVENMTKKTIEVMKEACGKK